MIDPIHAQFLKKASQIVQNNTIIKLEKLLQIRRGTSIEPIYFGSTFYS